MLGDLVFRYNPHMSEDKIPERDERVWRWVIYGLGALLVGSVIWSMLFETLLPLIRRGQMLSAFLHIIAFPLVFLGLGVLIWGAILFLRGTFGAFQDEELQRNLEDIQAKRAGMDQRWTNALILFRSWRRGALVMALGFAIIALSGFTMNAPRIFGWE